MFNPPNHFTHLSFGWIGLIQQTYGPMFVLPPSSVLRVVTRKVPFQHVQAAAPDCQGVAMDGMDTKSCPFAIHDVGNIWHHISQAMGMIGFLALSQHRLPRFLMLSTAEWRRGAERWAFGPGDEVTKWISPAVDCHVISGTRFFHWLYEVFGSETDFKGYMH